MSKNKGVSFGGWIQCNSWPIAEIMARYFDWVAIDLEHGLIGVDGCFSLIPVIQRHAKCFVRTWGNDYGCIARVLDAGCDGLIVPQVNSFEIAERVVRSACYLEANSDFSRLGTRGFGVGRAQSFNPSVDLSKLSSELILQIEHKDAVGEIEKILLLDIDGVFLGPYDLTMSMGIPGKFDHPSYKQAVKVVLEAATRHGKIAGIHVVDCDIKTIKSYIASGFSFIAVGTDMVIIRKALLDLRSELGL